MLIPVSVSVCTVLSCVLVVGLVVADQPAVDPGVSPLHKVQLLQKLRHDLRGKVNHLPLESEPQDAQVPHDAKAAVLTDELPGGQRLPILDDGPAKDEGQSVLAAAVAEEAGLLGQNACSDKSCMEDDDDDEDDDKTESHEGENQSKEEPANPAGEFLLNKCSVSKLTVHQLTLMCLSVCRRSSKTSMHCDHESPTTGVKLSQMAS